MKVSASTIELAPRTKTQATCDALEKLAIQAGPEGKLPTVQVLCDTWNISRVTLDRAMGQLERRGVIVRKPGQGTFAAPAKVKTVGVLFGLDPFRISCSPFYPLLFDAIRQELTENNLELETYVDLSYEKNHQKVRNRLQADIETGHVQGVLLPGSGSEQWQWASNLNIPIVANYRSWTNGYSVGFDWGFMVKYWVAELAKQGCKRIGMISHSRPLYVNEQCAFKEALSQHKLPIDSKLIFQLTAKEGEYSTPLAPSCDEQSYKLGKKLASSYEKLPDGLVICDDMIARGILTAFAQAGIKAGDDIQIATHTNKGSNALIGYEENLIHTELAPQKLARSMIAMLEMLMEGKAPDNEMILLQPEEACCKKDNTEIKKPIERTLKNLSGEEASNLPYSQRLALALSR